MKPGLYWQILLALLIGAGIGILFPTTYKITDNSISEFQNLKFPNELIHILIKESKDFKETETEFLKRIKPAIGPEYYNRCKNDILQYSKYNAVLPYISWFGDLFLRILTMIIVPLVVSAIISGLSNVSNSQSLGRLGLKTIFYYFSTGTLAIFVGLFFVKIIEPGIGVDIAAAREFEVLPATHSFKDSLMNIVPTNVFEAFASSKMISVIFFSILFGFFITRINDRGRIFMSNFFNAAYEVMMQITQFVIRFLPLGILSLAAVFFADYSADIYKIRYILSSLGDYIFTVVAALLFHFIITLPLLVYIGFKSNPWKHFKAMRSALITAFFTSSSIATLSVTMNSVNKNCGVSNKVSSFTLPLGATISMDGTALYELITVFFIAQAYGMDLSLIETIIIVATTLLASIGSSGIPMSGLIMMSIVLTAVGLPLEGIGLLVVVDRFLEMFRTVLNVWSDSCGAIIIAKSEGEELKV